MQACEGYVENGKFYSTSEVLRKPGKLRAILTILDEPVVHSSARVGKAFWADFDRMAMESAHENHLLDDEAFARRPSGRNPIERIEELNIEDWAEE